jgi:dipeptidyl aminopeptidase/acylaminoacyl peptidase
MWRPVTGKFSVLTSDALPKIALSGNQQHALLSNPLEYEPQFDYEGPRDFYLLDLNTMEKKKILTKNFYPAYVIPLPGGRFFNYFKDDNWWTYDITQDIHTNLTGSLLTAFSGRVGLDPRAVYGIPGWNTDKKELLITDEFDIWTIKPDGTGSRRLTDGREKQITYRLGEPNDLSLRYIFDGLTIRTYGMDKEIYLHARGRDGKSGYFLWKNNRIDNPVVYENAKIDHLSYSFDKKKVVYSKQRFDLAPQLVFKEENSKANIFFQSNPQHQNFHWGKSELIYYENSKHQKLRGVLYYPALYDPHKKYPMIVKIYAVQSTELHNYITPSMNNPSGFNTTVLTSRGYFVFLPDIFHEVGNVGPSALDCVSAGVKKVILMGIIDPTRIGLTGHSFGGYETVFISNHTKLFKTAIAGAAVIDLTSFFLTIGWNTGRPDMWRFYKEQWQMGGKTPFQHPEDFKRNSPLASVTNLQIPMLHWSGKADVQVDWHQSIEYYLALRRLGKKNIMLLYPKEPHILTVPANQEDLTQRILQWFGYFLKDEKNVDWINNLINNP